MDFVDDSSGRNGLGDGDRHDHEEISLEMVPQVPEEEEAQVEEEDLDSDLATPGMSTEVDERGDLLTEEVGADL